MSQEQVFADVGTFAARLRKLRAKRRRTVSSGRSRRGRRSRPGKTSREAILLKTGGRCHLCGGAITETDWQADHVLAHSTGGKHSAENYLPAHSICNNYR